MFMRFIHDLQQKYLHLQRCTIDRNNFNEGNGYAMMGASASVDLVMGASVLLSWRSGFRLFFNLGLCVCGAGRGGRSVFTSLRFWNAYETLHSHKIGEVHELVPKRFEFFSAIFKHCFHMVSFLSGTFLRHFFLGSSSCVGAFHAFLPSNTARGRVRASFCFKKFLTIVFFVSSPLWHRASQSMIP